MTTPTDHDLNVSLARLMGWTLEQNDGEPHLLVALPGHAGHRRWADAGEWYIVRGLEECFIPDYRGSIDALFAPGGPVEYARAKGWGIELTIEAGNESDNWNAWATHDAIDAAHAYGPSPAEALATALHEAFMKEQGQ